MVLRKSYLDKIIPFIDQDLIKVLVGIRRCGKTVLLGQIKDVLLQRNIPAQNIIQANFESMRFRNTRTAETLYDYIAEKAEGCTGKITTYLDDLYEAIIVRDIMLRHNIREQTALRNVLAFLLDNIGNPFSARNISGRMVSEGIKTTTATVLNYVDYFKEAFILLNASRYDIKGKALLSSTEKYYAVDLGLRNVIKKSEKLDSNKLYENIVYLEMRSRGYEVQVGKLDDTEIDFICYRGDEKLYIQVAYLITPADEEREFGNLERLHDNYPKYVISGDLVNLSRNGIIHRNIIDFLLNP